MGNEMRIGIPKEIKVSEYRVAINPVGVYEPTKAGHIKGKVTCRGVAEAFGLDYEAPLEAL